jgi:6-pyruvoyl-tetrahydropterin synthase
MRIEADKLDSMGFVIDFTKVKPAMKGALAILDHQGLVVAGAMCEAVDTEGRILVHNEDEVYDLPGDEVVMLPIPAATAEALAAWAGTQIWKQIPDEDLERITYAEVTFWETPNTGATFVIRERRAEY